MHASKLHIYQYTNVAIWLSSIKINISDPKIGILQAKTFLYVGQKALLDSFVTISVTIDGLVFPWMSQNSRSFSENCTQHRQAAEGGFSEWQTRSARRKPGSFQKLWAICYCYGGKDSSLDFPVNRHQVPLPGAPFVMIWLNEPAASIMGGLLWGMEAGGLKRERFQYSDRKVWRFFLLLGGEWEG